MATSKRILFLLIVICDCIIKGLIIKNTIDNNKLNLSKSKKSVETLYSIEQDFNRGDGYQYYVPPKYDKNPHLVIGDEEEVYQHAVKSKLESTATASPLLDQQLFLHNHQELQDALRTTLSTNPLLAALFLSNTLGLPPAAVSTRSYNHSAHLPVNPYISLLLSHYGRYIQPPNGRHQRGIYGYAAANNYHNNKPFGSYKIYEDAKK